MSVVGSKIDSAEDEAQSRQGGRPMAPRNGDREKRDSVNGQTRESLEKMGVRYCFSSYVDAHGVMKGKAVPIDHFDRMMRGSELYTGAALDG